LIGDSKLKHIKKSPKVLSLLFLSVEQNCPSESIVLVKTNSEFTVPIALTNKTTKLRNKNLSY